MDPANANCVADLKGFISKLSKLTLPSSEDVEKFSDSQCAATISKLQDVLPNADIQRALSNTVALDKKAVKLAEEAAAATRAAHNEVEAAIKDLDDRKVALSTSFNEWTIHLRKVRDAQNTTTRSSAIILRAEDALKRMQQKLQKGSMKAPPSMASTATTTAPSGVHARTDPAHLRRSRACIDPAHLRRSRAFASIPCARTDHTHTCVDPALAWIPCASVDPAHSHRSRALASIPCAPPFNQADPASSDYTGSVIGASGDDASSSCAPVNATIASGDGVDAMLAAFLTGHDRLQPRTQEIMLKARNDGYALVDFQTEAADRTEEELLVWLTGTVGLRKATADALARALKAPSAPALSKAQPAYEEPPDGESTQGAAAKRGCRTGAPASAPTRAAVCLH
jgi:hypothetical protein